jgi:hypothetical protein
MYCYNCWPKKEHGCKALYQLKRKVGMKWLMNWQSCSRVCAHSLERLQGVQQYHVKPANNNNNIMSLEVEVKMICFERRRRSGKGAVQQ